MRDQKWHSISFAEIQKPAKEHMITITKHQDRKMGGAGGFGKKATNYNFSLFCYIYVSIFV